MVLLVGQVFYRLSIILLAKLSVTNLLNPDFHPSTPLRNPLWLTRHDGRLTELLAKQGGGLNSQTQWRCKKVGRSYGKHRKYGKIIYKIIYEWWLLAGKINRSTLHGLPNPLIFCDFNGKIHFCQIKIRFFAR